MVFKAKLVALLSLEGGWKRDDHDYTHLLLQALFRISVVDDGELKIGQRDRIHR